jgi:hypothetical protein
MTLDPVLLEEAIRGGDASGVLELLRDATEADRRACAKALADLLKGPGVPMPKPIVFGNLSEGIGFLFEQMATSMAGMHAEPGEPEQAYRGWRELSETPAFIAAAVGLARDRRQADEVLGNQSPLGELPDAGYDVIARVLSDRAPSWLDELVRRGLTGASFGLNNWRLARRLVRAGAIERPDVPEYTIQMPLFLNSGAGGQGPGPLGELLADPGLLEDEVWRLFTVPGAATWLDQWNNGWSDALALLAERGLLDRGRLLDECLEAFVRDFPPNAVGWFVKLHDRLAPAPNEIAARTSKYLALLAAANKPGVSLGQRVCGTLLDAGALPAEAFLAACGAALVFPQKAVAIAQLKLIGKVAADPAARDLALATAAQAFAHVREDVQFAALKLIAKHGVPADPAARATIVGYAAALAPTLQPEAIALGLVPAAPPALALAAPASAPVMPDPAGAARRDAPEPCVPVTDPAELVQLFARLMEDASDSLAVERAMAGAVRLAALPLDERGRLASPVLKRAQTRALEDWYGPFSGNKIRSDVAWLAATWATGRAPVYPEMRPWGGELFEEVTRSGAARTMAGILSARMSEACALIAAGTAGPLLAEPEFADGTISHDGQLGRLARRPGGTRPPRYDLEVALLRLAPGVGAEFWAQWARLDEQSAPAARRGYEESHAPLDFEPQVLDVTRNRLAYFEMPPVLAAGAPAAAPESACWRLLTDLASRLQTLHGRRNVDHVRLDEIVAAWPLLCPHQPELIAAHLLRPLTDGLEPGPSAATVALGGLAPPGRAFGEIGHMALAAGLASGEPDTRIAAASVWTRVALDGRLDPARAAGAIAFGVQAALFKPNRVADALRHACLEPAAALAAAHALAAATAALLPAKPAGLHLFLETAARALATAGPPPGPPSPAGPPPGAPSTAGNSPGAPSTAGKPPGSIAVPPAIADLAGSRDRSKLAEAARRLVLLASTSQPR